MRIGTKHRVESALLGALLIALPLAAGCRQKMADQPSYKRFAPCDFFADGWKLGPLDSSDPGSCHEDPSALGRRFFADRLWH
jgi:hypothetical protein